MPERGSAEVVKVVVSGHLRLPFDTSTFKGAAIKYGWDQGGGEGARA